MARAVWPGQVAERYDEGAWRIVYSAGWLVAMGIAGWLATVLGVVGGLVIAHKTWQARGLTSGCCGAAPRL